MVLAMLLSASMVSAVNGVAIDTKMAARYFQEAKWASDDDAGALWGKPLYGPMVFVDPGTLEVVANEEPPGMGLRKEGDVFVGKLPPDIGVANTAFDYKGKEWSMVMWPLPKNRLERTRLIMHELWHRIQAEVGLPSVSVRNAHLDTMDGRIWLRMEIAALEKALLAGPDDRTAFQQDALAFRAYRQSLFPGSKAEEDRMEMHEGLAEYTGWMLRGSFQPEGRLALAYLKLRVFHTNPSFPSSFAYSTGPAYGMFLNLSTANWNRGLSPTSSIADLLATAVSFRPDSDLKADAYKRGQRYALQDVISQETARETERKAREANYTKMLSEGPILDLPLGKMNFSYDPNTVFPLGALGTIYPQSTVIDEWGKIAVSGAARITPDFKHVYVPAPAKATDRSGEGWTLELNPGWKLVPGKRKGDFVVVKG
jgi:hypothetical protein